MTTRKSPLSRLETEKFRAKLLKLITTEPRNCIELATQFKMHDKTMMNHLRALNHLGLIHATKLGASGRLPYMWTVGPGEAIKRGKYRKKPIPGAKEKQSRVTSWPPVTVPKQTIWSAVMG